MEERGEPPAIAARTLVGAVEFLAQYQLSDQRPLELRQMIKQLGYFITMIFLGGEAAVPSSAKG